MVELNRFLFQLCASFSFIRLDSTRFRLRSCSAGIVAISFAPHLIIILFGTGTLYSVAISELIIRGIRTCRLWNIELSSHAFEIAFMHRRRHVFHSGVLDERMADKWYNLGGCQSAVRYESVDNGPSHSSVKFQGKWFGKSQRWRWFWCDTFSNGSCVKEPNCRRGQNEEKQWNWRGTASWMHYYFYSSAIFASPATCLSISPFHWIFHYCDVPHRRWLDAIRNVRKKKHDDVTW